MPANRFPELILVEPDPKHSPRTCDLCYVNEVDDIIHGYSRELRLMYRDERDGIIVCHVCAMQGRYLDLEEPGHA